MCIRDSYVAAGVDPATRNHADLAARVAIMKRVWAGEQVVDALKPVGPAPYRRGGPEPVSYTHLRAHETVLDLVCRLLLEKKHTIPS